MKTIRTDADHVDFTGLVQLLDAYLAKQDGEEHVFYAAYNTLDAIRHVIIIYHDDVAVSCGAIKPFDDTSMEVKRMFTLPAYRGNGFARHVLRALEDWAKELGYTRLILETGKRQPEAVSLYTHSGYAVIPNYGQYAGIDNSVCFEKWL